MNITMREATSSDLPSVLALYAQPGMDDGKTISLAQAQRIHEQFSRYPNYRLFVACEGSDSGRVVGTCALLIMHNLAHRGTPSAIVEDVVVSQERRRQGIGALMMAHVRDLARQAGCYKLVLSSNQKRAPAHAFYESLGFQRHGYSFLIEI